MALEAHKVCLGVTMFLLSVLMFRQSWVIRLLTGIIHKSISTEHFSPFRLRMCAKTPGLVMMKGQGLWYKLVIGRH